MPKFCGGSSKEAKKKLAAYFFGGVASEKVSWYLLRMKIRCSIIGLGFWGKIFLAKILKNPHFELNAVVSRSKPQLDLGGARHFFTAEEAFAECPVDLVFILSPLEQHFKVATLALSYSQNIFLTKPIVANAKEAMALKRLALRKSVHIFVDHTFLFNQNFLKFQSMLAGKKMKSLASTRTQFGKFQKGSDVLGELLYHDIYMSLVLMGGVMPLAVQAVGGQSATIAGRSKPSINQCTLSLEYSSGCRLELFGSMNFERKFKIMNAMTENHITSWQDMAPSILTQVKYKSGFGSNAKLGPAKNITQPFPPQKDAIEAMFKHIEKCLAQKKNSRIIGIDQGIEIMQIIDAARKSHRIGRRVKL